MTRAATDIDHDLGRAIVKILQGFRQARADFALQRGGIVVAVRGARERAANLAVVEQIGHELLASLVR